MKKRTLAFVCAFAAALVFAYWGWMKNRSNQALTETVNQQSEQLSFEQKRLAQLRATLAEVQKNAAAPAATPGAEEARERINSLKEQIAQSESQLKALAADQNAVTQNSQDYKTDSRLSVADQILDLQRQIQEINAQIARQQANIVNFRRQPQTEDLAISVEDAQAEIQALTITRDQLAGQIQVVKNQGARRDVAATAQARIEQGEIFSEERQLKLRLEDLRSDLDYWENAQASASPAGQQARIAQLQKMIQELERRVR